jgi:hypothetical protein
MNYKDFDYIIGIDPGVNTGMAILDAENSALIHIKTVGIITAMASVINHSMVGKGVFVRFEDARLRTWFGKAGRGQLQGAGSIKRDCQIWEEFLTYHNIPFEAVAPKNNRTKVDAAEFKKLTGWQGKTNEHGRDAAMLVFGL